MLSLTIFLVLVVGSCCLFNRVQSSWVDLSGVLVRMLDIAFTFCDDWCIFGIVKTPVLLPFRLISMGSPMEGWWIAGWWQFYVVYCWTESPWHCWSLYPHDKLNSNDKERKFDIPTDTVCLVLVSTSYYTFFARPDCKANCIFQPKLKPKWNPCTHGSNMKWVESLMGMNTITGTGMTNHGLKPSDRHAHQVTDHTLQVTDHTLHQESKILK